MKNRKKYSYNDRANYHDRRYQSFVDRFRRKVEYGVTLDLHALEKETKKRPKIQYSDGFSTFAHEITRGHIRHADDLKGESIAFRRGYNAALSAFEKSKNIKF